MSRPTHSGLSCVAFVCIKAALHFTKELPRAYVCSKNMAIALAQFVIIIIIKLPN
jgi:hypothetical protein